MCKKNNNEVKSILNISKQFVADYYATEATAKDKKWMKKRMTELEKIEGKQSAFSKFRPEFAEKFFPDLKSAPKKQPSLLEMFEAVDKAG